MDGVPVREQLFKRRNLLLLALHPPPDVAPFRRWQVFDVDEGGDEGRLGQVGDAQR
jgi:hypothetical protein